MAAVVGDLVSDPSSHFHAMIAAPAIQTQHAHQASHYQPRLASGTSSRRRESVVPRYQVSASGWEPTTAHPAETSTQTSTSAGASQLPSPPHSSADQDTSERSELPASQDESSVWMESTDRDAPLRRSIPGPANDQPAQPAQLAQQQPSPGSDESLLTDLDKSYLGTATSPRLRGQTIRMRDLAHIQSIAKAELITGTGTGILDEHSDAGVRYEISDMPIGEIIEMVAALLTKITTTNDLQHHAIQRDMSRQQQQQQQAVQAGGGGGGGGNTSAPIQHPVNASVLAFHGKNVPAITILSYLSRIHKYCPTTYEVFLSLLVYFDRMTERVSCMASSGKPPRPKSTITRSEQHDEEEPAGPEQSTEIYDTGSAMVDDSDLADSDEESAAAPRGAGRAGPSARSVTAPLVTYFMVDSYNIHRLVIAGVTCASKFFSDVFYTNSRYAKVGGLPLAELNHLELQFLVLNDFRLQVDVETLEQYATMLVEFYAREVVAQRSRPVVGME